MSGRFKDRDWDLAGSNGNIDWSKVPIAVLMDIRDELRSLNRLLACQNFMRIPATLRGIRENTTPKPPRKQRRA